MSKIGLIGGSGVDDLLLASGFDNKEIITEYGKVMIKEGMVEGRRVAFLNRHGEKYSPPHEINSRANLQALQRSGVKQILATAAVGSMSLKMKPGNFVLLSDFIDFTRGRVEYFDPSRFTDMSAPYDAALAALVRKAAAKIKLKVHPSAAYACAEGPRFETKAEIKMYRKMGADVVGMTQVPEVVLAAELGMPYAVIGIVTNYASGISAEKVTSEEVIRMMSEKSGKLSELLLQTIRLIP
jgi:5'-methylthioadenosine phosphorylase